MRIARVRSFVLSCSVLAILALSGSAIRAEDPKPAPHIDSPKPAPHAESPTPASIDRNGVLILIRTTLLALDDANKSGNYTVLRDLGAPAFQANSDARLAEIFAAQRKENLDLSGVAVLEPQLTVLPQIEPSGMMRMAGFFPSVPTQVNFELLYAPVNRQWRLFGLAVSLGQAAPVAPAPPAEQPLARRPEPKGKKVPEARAAPPPGRPKPLTQVKE